MKKIITLLLIVLFFMQLSFFSSFPVVARFDLVLLQILVLAVLYEFNEMTSWIILAGVLMDLFTTTGFGIYLIALLVAAYLVDLTRRNILSDKRNKLMLFVIFSFSKVLFDLILWRLSIIFLYFKLSTVEITILNDGLLKYGINLLFFSFAGVFLFRIFDRLDKIIGRGRLDLKLSSH